MSAAGGPFSEPLASQDSWTALRIDSRQGQHGPSNEEPPPAPAPSLPAEPSPGGASKTAEAAAGAAEGFGTAAAPAAAGEEAPAAGTRPAEGAELRAVLVDHAEPPWQKEQPAEDEPQQEENLPLASFAEPEAAEPAVQRPEPVFAAPADEMAAQDITPSTASTAEEDQSALIMDAHLHHSHKGGSRASRRWPPPPSTEGSAGGEAAEPHSGSDNRQEGGGILDELERHRHQQKQLVMEGKVRQELESMLQRIEGHFRTEQAARRRTEEALALAAGERDALRGQLEAERMQQAAMLQQAMQERSMLEAQLAAISAEREQTRQEAAARLEAMAAEVAAWRASAEGVAQQAEQARRELAERAAEIEGTSSKIRSVAELLITPCSPTGAQDAFLGSPPHGSPGAGRQAGLQFHRSPGGSGGSGGRAKSKLPILKTRAIPGTTLRQPGEEGGSPSGSPIIGALPALSPGAQGLQRERSAAGGVAWSASGKAADRSAESQRDYARTAHMARWNKT